MIKEFIGFYKSMNMTLDKYMKEHILKFLIIIGITTMLFTNIDTTIVRSFDLKGFQIRGGIFAAIGVVSAYLIINSKFKYYELLPRKKKKIVNNVFLFAYSTVIVSFVFLTLSFFIIMLCFSVLFTFIDPSAQTITITINELTRIFSISFLKSEVLYIVVLSLIILYMITASFIKNSKIRIITMASIWIVAKVILMNFKNALMLISTNGSDSIYSSFFNLPNANMYFAIIIAVFLISIPVCIKISNNLYIKRSIK